MNKQMKTSELSGAALDWAVAKCEGCASFGKTNHGTEKTALIDDAGTWRKFAPSTNWEQGGPIIERRRIQLRPMRGDEWDAYWGLAKGGRGAAPLIAAMRCYVASKLGDIVEIPKELSE